MRMIFSRQVCLKFLQCIWALMLGSCGIVCRVKHSALKALPYGLAPSGTGVQCTKKLSPERSWHGAVWRCYDLVRSEFQSWLTSWTLHLAHMLPVSSSSANYWAAIPLPVPSKYSFPRNPSAAAIVSRLVMVKIATPESELEPAYQLQPGRELASVATRCGRCPLT